jgi:hypothetical protein
MLFHYASTFLPLQYFNKFLPSDLKSPGLQLNSVPTSPPFNQLLLSSQNQKKSTSTFNFASESFSPHVMPALIQLLLCTPNPCPCSHLSSFHIANFNPSCSVSLVSSRTPQLLAIVVGSINLAQTDSVLPPQFFRFSISVIPCSCKLPEQHGELKTEKCST